MTKETQIKYFKIYMAQGDKDKAYAIFSGNPPAELLEEPKEEEETKKTKSKGEK